MEWDEIVTESESIGIEVKSVMQEEMQKAILAYLSRKGCFRTIVFHGGTALRLFHGNPRFSEDIDLVLGKGVHPIDLYDYMVGIDVFCRGRFPFLTEYDLKAQKRDDFLQRLILKARSDLIDVRLHIELANVPSYINGSRLLDYPPFHPAIRVEEPSEILADKVRALAYRPYLKGRDLWDIHFLRKERSVDLDWDLVIKKIDDYHEPVDELDSRLDKVKEFLMKDGAMVLEKEMKRFLPSSVMEGYREGFHRALDVVLELISDHDEGSGETR